MHNIINRKAYYTLTPHNAIVLLRYSTRTLTIKLLYLQVTVFFSTFYLDTNSFLAW